MGYDAQRQLVSSDRAQRQASPGAPLFVGRWAVSRRSISANSTASGRGVPLNGEGVRGWRLQRGRPGVERALWMGMSSMLGPARALAARSAEFVRGIDSSPARGFCGVSITSRRGAIGCRHSTWRAAKEVV